VHGGKWAVRIDRSGLPVAQNFSTITRVLPVNFAGKTVELRGFIRTEDVSEMAGLWMRQDGDTPGLAFDNMAAKQLKGTTDWTEYSIVLPLHADARQLYFGFLVAGSGKGWADDLQLLVDGKPIWEAPPAVRAATVIDTDHEFDKGSKVSAREFTPAQVANLQLLGKVWGFLKYHHPSVTAGKLHWDYELFRVLPTVLQAADADAGRNVIDQWLAKLGEAPACEKCASLDESKIHLRPRLDWLRDAKLLGQSLSDRLQAIHRNRPSAPTQFFVAKSLNVGNPRFDHEPAYAHIKAPDTGYQLLALYRMWNIIEYWFPYRDVLDENWDDVLREFVPRIGLAQDHDAYQLQLMALIAKVQDTHANLWSSINIRPPAGACMAPIATRFIDGQAVVTGYSNAEAAAATTLKPGDVIESLDGVPLKTLVARWAPYYAASNEPTRLRDMARMLTRGPCGDVAVRARRGVEALDVKAKRIPAAELKINPFNDQPGETFRKLSDEVAYLKLSSVKMADAEKYVTQAAGTKGLVIDLRNYPSEFMVFALGSFLVDKPTPFVVFTSGDPANPGAFHWGSPLEITPRLPHYAGKVAILIDEVTQSSAEYTTMAFRASPRATVIGSTTAGADGNISPIPLPGGLRSMISGIGVFYPDRRPTQKVGIVPDIHARPTIEGIRSGRDEVLERALRVILGPEKPDGEIQTLARPH
ncbi:MAG TPA: S41 family peptidase, partial [Bryobacteraceae bacterium]|nr:S41 family peptidase [Bryobacteraceae bacterium]